MKKNKLIYLLLLTAQLMTCSQNSMQKLNTKDYDDMMTYIVHQAFTQPDNQNSLQEITTFIKNDSGFNEQTKQAILFPLSRNIKTFQLIAQTVHLDLTLSTQNPLIKNNHRTSAIIYRTKILQKIPDICKNHHLHEKLQEYITMWARKNIYNKYLELIKASEELHSQTTEELPNE